MKKKVGYPKTKELLDALHYPARDVMIQGFGPFTYMHRDQETREPTRRHHPLLNGLILYPIYLWEKHRNLH
jgi:hypothetical protein